MWGEKMVERIQPYFEVVERQTNLAEKRYYTFFAFQLDSVLFLSSEEQRNNESIMRFLADQIQFISCLHSSDSSSIVSQDMSPSFQLRYISFPKYDNWLEGQLNIAIIAKTSANTKQISYQKAGKLYNELRIILESGALDIYKLSAVTTKDGFHQLFKPFDINQIAEITRREEEIEFSVGKVYVPCQFTWTENTFSKVCKAMMLQKTPTMLSILLQPTELDVLERNFFTDIIRISDEESQVSVPYNITTDTSRKYAPKLQCVDIKIAYLQQLRQLAKPFLMKIQVASTDTISESFLNIIGTEITRPAGTITSTIEKSAVQNDYLSGGFSTQTVFSSAEKMLAIEDLQFQEFNLHSYTVAPKNVQRIRFLVDARQANCAFRLPIPSEDIPGVKLHYVKPSIPPFEITTNDGIIIGESYSENSVVSVKISNQDRRKHIYIIGQTGTGKSNLLLNMIISDIYAGKGVCVIDPHGDLIDQIVVRIPKHRVDDVILFDPGDTERPIGLNILETKSKFEKDFVVQEIISIIKKLFPPEYMGPIWEHSIRNAILSLLELQNDNYNPTLIDLIRIFVDANFQSAVAKRVQDPIVKLYWKEQELISDSQKSDILTYLISKFGRFVENTTMRNIVGQSYSKIDFGDIIDNQKIILYNLSKGKLGEINSSLLGLVLMYKLEMAFMRRAELPETRRKDFYLYIDEFHTLTTDSLLHLLCEGRKYRLNMVISHQHIKQVNSDVSESIFGNVGTLICFRVSSQDAKLLANEFSPTIKPEELTYLPDYTAVVKMLTNGTKTRPFTMKTTINDSPIDTSVAFKIKELSQLKYGLPKHVVEREIKDRLKYLTPSDEDNVKFVKW